MENQKKKTQIKQGRDELRDRTVDPLSGEVKPSQFNHRKNKAGSHVNLETSPKLETVEQLNSEQPLDNDSLGG